MRSDYGKLITDESTLYIDKNKKRTRAWFQGLGDSSAPFAGTKFGFIRSIAYQNENSNSNEKYSMKDDLLSDLKGTSEVAMLTKENKQLKKAVESLKEQMQLTHGMVPTKAATAELAKNFVGRVQS